MRTTGWSRARIVYDGSHCWIPFITYRQRGFLHGRSMMRNITVLEHAAMVAACEEEEEAIILLFDFTAAFPSLSRRFMFASLLQLGFPTIAMNVI